MTDKTFGTKSTNVCYREIKGAYLIAMEGGEIHAIRHANGAVTLPGAEIPNGASHEEAILGACLAQTGYDVAVDDYVTDADLFDSDKELHLTETYYSGEFIEKIAPQGDPSVKHVRISLQDTEMLSPMQRYAVLQCAEMLRADAHGSDDEDL